MHNTGYKPLKQTYEQSSSSSETPNNFWSTLVNKRTNGTDNKIASL